MGGRKITGRAATNNTTMTELSDRRTEPAPDAASIDWPAALAQHDRWLRTALYARLGDPQAVDDVMQEVALAAVAQRAPLRDANKVAPWLYRLAIRQSLLYRRTLGRRRKLIDRYADRVVPASGPRQSDALQWLLADERRQLVRDALAKLTRRDSEILLLKYTEGWSYRRLAEHLGISESAVEARLHRARKRMRAELVAREVIEVEA